MAASHILFDLPQGVEPADREFLESLGHSVEVCHGPVHGAICPILTGHGCPVAEEADGIVFELDLDRPQHRAILRKYKESLPADLPIRVAVRPGQAKQYGDLLTGVHTWTWTPVAGDLDGLAAEIEAREG